MTTLMLPTLRSAFPQPTWTTRRVVVGTRAWLRAFVAPAATSSDVPAEVVGAAQRGDAKAFTQVVMHYDERLRALAFRLLQDRDLMDDALQESYIKAFRGLAKFEGTSSLGTWLYRVVYNTCLDQLRRPLRLVALDELGELASSEAAPDEQASERADLAAALAALPPDHRAAVMLVDADCMNYAEAGEVLGVPAGTIASRLSRARAALRASLEATQ